MRLGSGAGSVQSAYEGVEDNRLYIERDTAELSEATREGADAFITSARCSTCDGARLNARALACRIGGRNFAGSLTGEYLRKRLAARGA